MNYVVSVCDYVELRWYVFIKHDLGGKSSSSLNTTERYKVKIIDLHLMIVFPIESYLPNLECFYINVTASGKSMDRWVNVINIK